jgi:hypothetical protein
MIMVNAIDSEREGPDYLLSPTNRSSLFQASRNLQLACCWLPTTLEDLHPGHTLNVLDTQLSKPDKLAKISDADREVAIEARKWLEIALDDSKWRIMRPSISIPVHLGRLPLPVLKAASICPESENETILTTADVPLALREAAARIVDPDAITGSLLKAAQAARKSRNEMKVSPKNVKPKAKGNKTHLEHKVPSDNKSAVKSLRRSEKSATSERQNDAKDLEILDELSESPLKKHKTANRSLTSEPYSAIIVPPEVHALEMSFSSVSTKLNWVVEEALRNEDDFFLIFAKDAIMLGQLTDVSASS